MACNIVSEIPCVRFYECVSKFILNIIINERFTHIYLNVEIIRQNLHDARFDRK